MFEGRIATASSYWSKSILELEELVVQVTKVVQAIRVRKERHQQLQVIKVRRER